MIADFRWEPSRYQYQWKYIPDEKTRRSCLVLHKTAEVNCFGETRYEVEGEELDRFFLGTEKINAKLEAISWKIY